MKKLIVVLFILLVLLMLVGRLPIRTGDVTKQTVYLSLLNCFHIKDRNAEALMMLIDDDGGDGIFRIKQICDRVGCKATFAVVPAWLDPVRCDSLRRWQSEGHGIAVHGYNHGRWKDFSYEEVVDDIKTCLDSLKDKGFFIDRIHIVVSPGFNNTRAIRNAVKDMGFKMVCGASIVNPDTTAFQWGRLFVKKSTDMEMTREMLLRAKENNDFIVLGTHSSMPEEFSPEKTEEILRMGKEMGFRFIN